MNLVSNKSTKLVDRSTIHGIDIELAKAEAQLQREQARMVGSIALASLTISSAAYLAVSLISLPQSGFWLIVGSSILMSAVIIARIGSGSKLSSDLRLTKDRICKIKTIKQNQQDQRQVIEIPQRAIKVESNLPAKKACYCKRAENEYRFLKKSDENLHYIGQITGVYF